MLSLIVAILFGLSITFFAFQNSILVPVTLGSYNVAGTPRYIVVIASLLMGILMAWFISAVEGMSHFMNVRHKDGVINQDKKEIDGLQQKIDRLEAENARLREGKKEVVVENRPLQVHDTNIEHKPSFFDRLFPNSTRRYSKQI